MKIRLFVGIGIMPNNEVLKVSIYWVPFMSLKKMLIALVYDSQLDLTDFENHTLLYAKRQKNAS